MFHKQTINDIDLSGKTVLLRADYNVPLDEDGKITDDYRIEKSLPTVKALLEKNCRLVICSHLGRPEGKVNKKYSLEPVAERLGEKLGKNVMFTSDCVGEMRTKLQSHLKPGQVLLLENLRFYKEEEANDKEFAKRLIEGIDVFVQDGFGVVHRAHASTDAITKNIKSVAGLLLQNEVDVITKAMEKPERPLMAIIGGAKISDKIDMLNRLCDIADMVAVGGGMSNTFLLAEGIDIGASLAEKDEVTLAKDILRRARARTKKGSFVFYVPQDGVVATKIDEKTTTRIVDWGTHAIAEIENYPKNPPIASGEVSENEKILDIGPFSGAFIAGSMQQVGTVIWNGAMGVTEVDSLRTATGPFSQGTELIVEAMLGQFGHRPKTIVGGGDTVGYIEKRGLVKNFYHVSTGGGASMDLMSGKKLPGVEALADK
jgi:phosphoglycerate kinase